jgi:hypothetical protein
VSQLIAARIGRDAAVDWMVVAAIPLRDPILQCDNLGLRTRAKCRASGSAGSAFQWGLPARVERSTQTAELWFHKVGGDFWNGKPEQV